MNKTKKAAVAIALSTLAFGATGCSGDSDGASWDCEQVQISYDTLGVDRVYPDAIQYCLSIGEFTP